MAIKIRTVTTYNLDGVTTSFTIPFEYLARKFVTVTLIGTDRKELVLNQDYRFSTKTQITTSVAWGTGSGYQLIEIRRFTSATERLVDFSDGSILRAYDLNSSQIQTLHVAEEGRDAVAREVRPIVDGVQNLMNTALRVEDTTINPVGPAALRAGKVLGFNSVGQPALVLPADGTATDVMLELANPTGAGLIGTSSGRNVQTEFQAVRGEMGLVGDRVSGRNAVDGNIINDLNNIELAYNTLGATLDGNEAFRVDFTSSQTDTPSRLLFALQQVPSGYVFERLIAFGSLYCTMSIRKVNPRQPVGKPSILYSANIYNGLTIHTATVRGEYVKSMRMSYVDGTVRTPAEWMTYLNTRFVRLLTNASPAGGVGGFCTTINNGKLIQGNAADTYFWASCFLLPNGRLEVVPHKDTPVEQVVKNYYYNHDALQSMHFKYVLCKGGEVYDLVANGYTTPAGWGTILSGRTAIGQKYNGDLVLAVVDGNTTEGTGISVKGMAEYMLSQGCNEAMNIDGSGSSTMYYGNARVNSPSDGQERKVVNVIYFI